MEMEKQIQHWSHPWHPLVLVEEQSNENEKASCWGCGEVVSASSFSCLHCNYHLHKECAQAPRKIPNHPLHPQHSDGFFLRERPLTQFQGYACALCKEKLNMFFYECRYFNCYFALDIKCALSSQKLAESIINEFKDDGHQRPFIFLKNHKDEFKKIYCSLCHESLTDSIYVSVNCKAYIHKNCFKRLYSETYHPCHRLHSLVLQFDESDCFCEICQKNDNYNLFYHCFACKFDIHIDCLRSRPIIEEEKYHEHAFNLFFKDSFICDACGTNGKFVSYICHTCHVQVHKNCTSLPSIIKVTQHDHVIVRKYFLEKRALVKHECKICFEKVKTEHGSYHCLREDCNYIVHVKCATADEDFYYIIDQDKELDETNEATDSSIAFHVIEKNEHGEATEIKHFNHEHNLVFEDEVKEDNDRNCDGCMRSISTTFYHCSKCKFFLHKTCAKLPKIKYHWFYQVAATLEAKHFFHCDLCRHWCSGLSYKGIKDVEEFNFCLRCAIVSNIIRGQRHEHFLFFDYKCKNQCNACGVGSSYGAFRCKKCTNFTLDFACMTLPEAIQHRCDNHLLKLTYHDENDEHYCDICEEKRDPNHWYYYCSTCDNSVHPKCVLGIYPFIKDGMTWLYQGHRHNQEVIFFRKVDGYPECSVCDKLCQDEALKCSTCNLIVHIHCGDEKRW